MIATNIAIYTRLNTLLFDLLFVFASVIKLPLLCKTASFVLQIVNQIILSVDNYYSTDCLNCHPYSLHDGHVDDDGVFGIPPRKSRHRHAAILLSEAWSVG